MIENYIITVHRGLFFLQNVFCQMEMW
jgi:hypothetical protein